MSKKEKEEESFEREEEKSREYTVEKAFLGENEQML